MPTNFHYVQAGEDISKYTTFCSTSKAVMITTTADHTNLLPNGDGYPQTFTTVIGDKTVLWCRDNCPLDTTLAALVGQLPGMLDSAFQATATVTERVDRVIQMIDLLTTSINNWVGSQNLSENDRSYIETQLTPSIVMNFMVSQAWTSQV